MAEPERVKARRVPITLPAKRCVVCGDKIKSGAMIELLDFTEGICYLEEGCVEYFISGHPDRLEDSHVNRELLWQSA